MKSFVFALLLAASVFAQPVVGPVVTSDPLDNLDDYVIAPQRDGFVLAWTSAGRLYAGRLDATLHLTSPPLLLPLTQPGTNAATPAIASNGTSVLVAWHERRAGYAEFAFIALLSPDAQTLIKGPLPMNITKDGPLLTNAGGRYVIYTGDLRYVLNENLDVEEGQYIPRNKGAALAVGGNVATVNEVVTSSYNCTQICWSFLGHCAFVPPPSSCVAASSVMFTFGSTSYTAAYETTVPPNVQLPDPFAAAPPIIAGNGESYVGLVHIPTRTDVWFFSPFHAVTLQTPALGDGAIGANGNDVLVVWTTPELTGTIVHEDGVVSPAFPIAASASQPKVVAINSTEFLVLYKIDVDRQRSAIGGRIVQLPSAKRRGVR